MCDLSDSPLWNEYKQLSTAAESLVGKMLTVPTVALAIVSALAISDKFNKEYFGFGILIGMSLLATWLVFYHAMFNTYGVQLVEIESRINLRLANDSPDRLTYYTKMVTEGDTIPGYRRNMIILGLVGIIGYVYSIWGTWVTLESWKWPVVLRVICIVGLVLLSVIPIINMSKAEKEFHERKQKILAKYNEASKKVEAGVANRNSP